MSTGLTLGVTIANAATAILQRVEAFDQNNPQLPDGWDMRAHIGIDPMLLALSMELALKAWFVFDHNTAEYEKTHKLVKLFEALKQDSQHKLDAEFKRSVAPYHPNLLYCDYGIKDVFVQHEDAFCDWRYTHERKNISFDTGAFQATLKMVLSEFGKRYRTINLPPQITPWGRFR